MKKLKFIALSILGTMTLLNFTACQKIKDAVQVSIPMNSQEIEFTLPQIATIGTVDLLSVNFPINVDSIIKANNADFAMNNIKSVKVNSVQLKMIDGDANNNFSAIQDFAIRFKSSSDQSEISLATLTNNPDVEAYTMDVPVNSNLDLANYFKSNSFSFSGSGTTRKTTSKPIQCKATFGFTVKVGL